MAGSSGRAREQLFLSSSSTAAARGRRSGRGRTRRGAAGRPNGDAWPRLSLSVAGTKKGEGMEKERRRLLSRSVQKVTSPQRYRCRRRCLRRTRHCHVHLYSSAEPLPTLLSAADTPPSSPYFFTTSQIGGRALDVFFLLRCWSSFGRIVGALVCSTARYLLRVHAAARLLCVFD